MGASDVHIPTFAREHVSSEAGRLRAACHALAGNMDALPDGVMAAGGWWVVLIVVALTNNFAQV
jgi:hypothetical protein